MPQLCTRAAHFIRLHPPCLIGLVVRDPLRAITHGVVRPCCFVDSSYGVMLSCRPFLAYILRAPPRSGDRDISAWDVSSVGRMDQLFLNATSFDQDLGGWDVSGVFNDEEAFGDNTMESMFNGSALSTANYDSTLVGWAALDLNPDVTLGAEGIVPSSEAEDARRALIEEAGWTIRDEAAAQ